MIFASLIVPSHPTNPKVAHGHPYSEITMIEVIEMIEMKSWFDFFPAYCLSHPLRLDVLVARLVYDGLHCISDSDKPISIHQSHVGHTIRHERQFWYKKSSWILPFHRPFDVDVV